MLGIIGKNGAGKSTLLKILSKVTAPTTGSIKVKGRIASLLEVGTGFHPELTGRENIFLNGAILGMTKSEIYSKFDEIVDFSGVEKYIDTPVKRYSSGMYVRLAFAVAAQLEPEILIVDEVLAVGDAEFQKKALGKMQDVSKGHGRTILFVSHNLGAVQALCKSSVLLLDGRVAMFDNTHKVVDLYKNNQDLGKFIRIKESNELRINDITLNDKTSYALVNIYEEIRLRINFNIYKTNSKTIEFFILFYNQNDEVQQSLFQRDEQNKFPVLSLRSHINVEFKNLLPPGIYYVSVGAFDQNNDFLDWVKLPFKLEVSNTFVLGGLFDDRLGLSYNRAKWVVE